MEFEFSDVKPSLLSLLTVTVMAVIGISLFKYFSVRYNIPYLKEFMAAI